MTQPNPNSVFPEHKDKYYVYMLCRPDNSMFYIGKGKGVRINNHFNASNLTSNSIKNNIINKYGVENIKREIISYHDTEEEAFNVEEFLIASYGVMAEGGLLTNVAKTRWDYPDKVKGYIASGDPLPQRLYKDELVVQAYEMWFRDYCTRQEISEVTGIPINYLYHILSGKKAKGIYEADYIQKLKTNWNKELIKTVDYPATYHKELLFEIMDRYYKDNLHIDLIVEEFDIKETYIRAVVQGMKRKDILKEYLSLNTDVSRNMVKSSSLYKEDVLCDLKAGHSVETIARRYNVGKTSVRRWADQNGVDLPKNPQYKKELIIEVYNRYFILKEELPTIVDYTGISANYLKSLVSGYKRPKMLKEFLEENSISSGLNSGTGSANGSSGNSSDTNSDNAA